MAHRSDLRQSMCCNPHRMHVRLLWNAQTAEWLNLAFDLLSRNASITGNILAGQIIALMILFRTVLTSNHGQGSMSIALAWLRTFHTRKHRAHRVAKVSRCWGYCAMMYPCACVQVVAPSHQEAVQEDGERAESARLSRRVTRAGQRPRTSRMGHQVDADLIMRVAGLRRHRAAALLLSTFQMPTSPMP